MTGGTARRASASCGARVIGSLPSACRIVTELWRRGVGCKDFGPAGDAMPPPPRVVAAETVFPPPAAARGAVGKQHHEDEGHDQTDDNQHGTLPCRQFLDRVVERAAAYGRLFGDGAFRRMASSGLGTVPKRADMR